MFSTSHSRKLRIMNLKEHFINEWLKDNPDDDRSDALDAWKSEVKFINQFNDWDNQIDE